MIKTLLIANRGEIACRIIKTAKKMQIKTIAVYSDADENALHVEMADEKICIGSAAPTKSYLNHHAIIDAALKMKADAIHPGYGFLSENSNFAHAVQQSNLIFIGAPISALKSMADKSEAKKIMGAAGIPLIYGFNNPKGTTNDFLSAAQKMGYPVLLKATAGGGGKGMRIVNNAKELPEALESAKREALNSFGIPSMIMEQYIPTSRHIEVQIFFDQYGNGIYLFDRDCSMQRRYQKVIEEAPAPGLSNYTHQLLGETALKVGKAVNYIGAGTVEFLYDQHNNNAYFMEMNTRLQVEHPVTEMITGIDLVEWQLKIADGEILPLKQNELSLKGHAIEARLYAEQPNKKFTPATGKIHFLKWPKENEYLRIDTGIQNGDEITPWYDPMIAKIISWSNSRENTIKESQKALEKTIIAGLPTNREFLITLLNTQDFFNANLKTTYITENYTQLIQKNTNQLQNALTAVGLYFFNKKPSFMRNWRLNSNQLAVYILNYEDKNYSVKIQGDDSCSITINRTTIFNKITHFAVETIDNIKILTFLSDIKQKVTFRLFELTNKFFLISHKEIFTFTKNILFENSDTDSSSKAPMNGIVTSVSIKNGDYVKKDDTLLTIEAMKMEITVKSNIDGTVKVLFSKGDKVNEGDLLFVSEENN